MILDIFRNQSSACFDLLVQYNVEPTKVINSISSIRKSRRREIYSFIIDNAYLVISDIFLPSFD